MSANIETYIGRQSAWHRLGIVTGNFMTWEEIQSKAAMNFQVKKMNLLAPDGKLLTNAFGTFRLDKGFRDGFLGQVGDRYKPIQHEVGFNLIDNLVNSVDGAHYETAGVLGNGEVVWGLADLKLSTTIHNTEDRTDYYLLFSTSHDGSLSFTLRGTGVRVVCQNTLSVALNGKANSMFKILHTTNAQKKIDSTFATLQTMKDSVQELGEKFDILATKRVTKESMENILSRLFPTKGDNEISSRTKNTISSILDRFESNDGNTIPEIKGSAYNLLNGITEHTDHKEKANLKSVTFGHADSFKTHALNVISEVSQTMPEMSEKTVFSMPENYATPLDNILEMVEI